MGSLHSGNMGMIHILGGIEWEGMNKTIRAVTTVLPYHVTTVSWMKQQVPVPQQKICSLPSGQNGGIGRYTSLHCTTKRRATTTIKTNYNQNCQKIKLHGTLTTKEVRKKHSSRQAEMGSWGREESQKGED